MKDMIKLKAILKDNSVYLASDKYSIEINDTSLSSIKACSIDFFNDKITIKSSNQVINVYRWYEVLDFDISQLGNSRYINKKLFAPGARNYIKNEGMIVVIGLLLSKVRFYDFYPGLITLLTYKITEDYINLSSLEQLVIDERIALIDQSNVSSNDSVRWRVSSGFVVLVYLYTKHRYEDIALLYSEIIQYNKFLNKLPIISQNYYSSCLIYAISCMQNNKQNEVLSVTKSIFDGCQSALGNLVNSQNRSFISQSKDAHVIIDIANNAAILHSAMLSEHTNKVDSKSYLDFRYAPRVNFDINRVISRFGADLKKNNCFALADDSINNKYTGKV